MDGGGETSANEAVIPLFVTQAGGQFEVSHVPCKGSGEGKLAPFEGEGAWALVSCEFSLKIVEKGDMLGSDSSILFKLCPDRGNVGPGVDLAETHEDKLFPVCVWAGGLHAGGAVCSKGCRGDESGCVLVHLRRGK
jgi:hypothetical protein